MTTRTRNCSTAERLGQWLGPLAGPALATYLAAATRADATLLFPDLDAQVKALHPPALLSPPPSAAQVAAGGLYFDVTEVERFLRFCRKLRHVKTRQWGGRPFELDLWQVVFVAGPLFGWRRRGGLRLYTTVHLEVPKKNGKSTLCAAISLYALTADREPGAEVVAAASDREQARNVFGVSQRMAQRAPALRKRLRIGTRAIVNERTASSYKVLSADADLQEGQNIHVAVVDELQVHKKRTLVENLETATAAREQPIVVLVMTAGLDDPGSIYTEKRDLAERIATGQLDDLGYLVVIFAAAEGDDPFAESTWRKANPGFGISVRPEYLARAARKAKASAAALMTFKRLHLNIRTGRSSGWLPIEVWDRSGAFVSPTFEDLVATGAVAYGGLDLSSAVDLTAIALVVPRMETVEGEDQEVLDVVIRAWTPAATLAERAERDRAPYQDWVNDGWLIPSPGEVIDYDEVEAELFELARLLHIRRLHFDRWGSKQIVQHLRDGGVPVVEMGQGFASMSPPMKMFEVLVRERRLRHGGNPLLRWAVASMAVAQDSPGNIKPDRAKSTGRIDPVVALIMAIDAWDRRPGQGRSVYEDRGVEAG